MNSYNEVIYLQQPIIHDDGTEGAIITKAYCSKTSVGFNEFYSANQAGLRPELKFVLPDYRCYSDEPLLRYNNKLYNIIRTYQLGEKELELTCERVNNNGSI